MDRNREDGLPPADAEPGERLPKPDETVDRDPKNTTTQPQNTESEPVGRPDLDWAEHED